MPRRRYAILGAASDVERSSAEKLHAFGCLQAAAASGGPESGLVLLSVSVGSPELARQLDEADGAGELREDGSGRQLVSAPVSITFRGPDGRKIPMTSLTSPIEIRMPAESQGAFCAFWDEETASWSTRGLTLVSLEDGPNGPEVVCQTTHLTLFGAVLDTLIRVVRCSTASQVFSAQGFENLGKGKWLPYAPSIITCSAARQEGAAQAAHVTCPVTFEFSPDTSQGFVPLASHALVCHMPRQTAALVEVGTRCEKC